MAFDSPAPISRRTVAKGIAWTAPAVAIAGTAPAFAVSNPQVWFEPTDAACKLPGDACEKKIGVSKGYAVRVRVCTNVDETVLVDFTSASVSLNGGPSSTWSVGPDPLTIDPAPAGSQSCKYIDLGIEGQPNSANVSIQGTVYFTWEARDGFPSGSGSFSFSAPSTPPCKHCAQPTPA